jgi:hypothetical protein
MFLIILSAPCTFFVCKKNKKEISHMKPLGGEID